MIQQKTNYCSLLNPQAWRLKMCIDLSYHVCPSSPQLSKWLHVGHVHSLRSKQLLVHVHPHSRPLMSQLAAHLSLLLYSAFAIKFSCSKTVPFFGYKQISERSAQLPPLPILYLKQESCQIKLQSTGKP